MSADQTPENPVDNGSTVTPYVSPSESPPEATIKAVGAGILFGILFGAANAYLGLRAGLTISTSIPVVIRARMSVPRNSASYSSGEEWFSRLSRR